MFFHLCSLKGVICIILHLSGFILVLYFSSVLNFSDISSIFRYLLFSVSILVSPFPLSLLWRFIFFCVPSLLLPILPLSPWWISPVNCAHLLCSLSVISLQSMHSPLFPLLCLLLFISSLLLSVSSCVLQLFVSGFVLCYKHIRVKGLPFVILNWSQHWGPHHAIF